LVAAALLLLLLMKSARLALAAAAAAAAVLELGACALRAALGCQTRRLPLLLLLQRSP
jgi:hypothetical protein